MNQSDARIFDDSGDPGVRREPQDLQRYTEHLESPPKTWPPWNLLDVLLVAVAFVLAALIAGPIVLMVARLFPSLGKRSVDELRDNPLLLIPAEILSYLFGLWFVRFVVLFRSGGEPVFQTLSWGFSGLRFRYPALVMMAAGVLLAFLVNFTSIWLPIPKDLPMEEYFQTAADAYMTAFFGIVIAPFVEELFFRGLLYPALRVRLGFMPAVTLTAFVFALLHDHQLANAWAPLLMIFIVGLVLTMIRALTGSLASSWMVHASYNGTLFVFMFLATGGFRHLER